MAMDFLFGASPIQKKINAATDEMLLNPDWSMNTEICELANRNAECADEVIKAIKKRMNHRNADVACKALTLLDSVVKNGKKFVHQNVAKQDFLAELQKVAKRPDFAPRDQALSLIMSWAESFKDKGQQYSTFWNAYMALQSQGVDFPAPEEAVPVFTPQRSVEAPRRSTASAASSSATPTAGAPATADQQAASEKADPEANKVTEEYMVKIKKDLEIVVNFLVLSREMLLASVDAGVAKKDSTLRALMRNMKEVQTRFLYLLVELPHEGLVDLILELNELVFLTIEWYRALRDGKEVSATPEFDQEVLLKEILEVEDRKSADVGPSDEKESKEKDNDVDVDDEFAMIAKRGDDPEVKSRDEDDDTNLIDLEFDDDEASHKRSSSIDELLNFDVGGDSKSTDDSPDKTATATAAGDSSSALPTSVADLDDHLLDFNIDDDDDGDIVTAAGGSGR